MAKDSELDAIQTLLGVLEPLDNEQRRRVLDYVFKRLGIEASGGEAVLPARIHEPPSVTLTPPPAVVTEGDLTDIRTFAEKKSPSADVERVAVVAYYLAELAPKNIRTSEITRHDLEKYFKQAGFPIPQRPAHALVNTKNAGYIDAGSGRGTYKLNPVGHNLVVHSLGTTKKKKKPRKAARKRPPRKKGSPKKKIKGRQKMKR